MTPDRFIDVQDPQRIPCFAYTDKLSLSIHLKSKMSACELEEGLPAVRMGSTRLTHLKDQAMIFEIYSVCGCGDYSHICQLGQDFFLSFSFLKSLSVFQNKIKHKAISNSIYPELRNLCPKRFSCRCLHVRRGTQKPLAGSLAMP